MCRGIMIWLWKIPMHLKRRWSKRIKKPIKPWNRWAPSSKTKPNKNWQLNKARKCCKNKKNGGNRWRWNWNPNTKTKKKKTSTKWISYKQKIKNYRLWSKPSNLNPNQWFQNNNRSLCEKKMLNSQLLRNRVSQWRNQMLSKPAKPAASASANKESSSTPKTKLINSWKLRSWKIHLIRRWDFLVLASQRKDPKLVNKEGEIKKCQRLKRWMLHRKLNHHALKPLLLSQRAR